MCGKDIVLRFAVSITVFRVIVKVVIVLLVDHTEKFVVAVGCCLRQRESNGHTFETDKYDSKNASQKGGVLFVSACHCKVRNYFLPSGSVPLYSAIL